VTLGVKNHFWFDCLFFYKKRTITNYRMGVVLYSHS
jgi:hypothetical protein